jgi:hypothetical protein
MLPKGQLAKQHAKKPSSSSMQLTVTVGTVGAMGARVGSGVGARVGAEFAEFGAGVGRRFGGTFGARVIWPPFDWRTPISMKR